MEKSCDLSFAKAELERERERERERDGEIKRDRVELFYYFPSIS